MLDALSDANAARQARLSLLARARPAELQELFEATLPDPPQFTWLRAPEIGSVMVRGRAGGTGAPFNLGEITVTRASLALDTGEIGHGYVQGRHKAAAQTVALIDALMQTPHADTLSRDVLDVLAERDARRKQERAEKAAATKVSFFTLARGEDT